MSYPKLRDNIWKRDYPVQRHSYIPGCSQIISHCGLRTVRRGGKMQQEVRIEQHPKDRSCKASGVTSISLDFIAKFLRKWKVTGGH